MIGGEINVTSSISVQTYIHFVYLYLILNSIKLKLVDIIKNDYKIKDGNKVQIEFYNLFYILRD